MRLSLPLLTLLLGLFVAMISAASEPLVTGTGSYYDAALNQTCYDYVVSCNGADCPAVNGFDLGSSCPYTSGTPSLVKSGLNSFKFSDGGGNGETSAQGLNDFKICVPGNVPETVQTKVTLHTIIIIIIIIDLPDCDCACPTVRPTECPTPTPTVEPTIPQGETVCTFVIEPTVVVINSTTQLEVSLGGTQPTGLVSVTLSASCVFLSSCLIEFDPINWLVPQVIDIVRNPAFPGNNCTIELIASGNQECNASIPVTILPQPVTPGQSYADPHIVTFDGLAYRSFGTGDFYLVRQFNGNLVIQARQTSCGPASCNSAIAIRFGSFEFYLVLAANGQVFTQIVGDAAANGVTIVTQGDKTTVFLAGGGSVVIQAHTTLPNVFLDIVVYLPDFYKGQVGGLLGEFDGNVANDLTLLVSGLPAPDLAAFLASNVVPAGENLFANSQAIIPLIRGASPPEPFEVGATCTPFTPANDVTASLQANAGLQSPLSGTPLRQAVGSNANCAFPNAQVEQAAIATCSKLFTPELVTCCKAFNVTRDSYYQSCLCDYALIQTANFVSAHLLAFASTCEGAANKKFKSCTGAASQIDIPTIPGSHPCDSNPCLNDGVCSNDGDNYRCNCAGTGFNGARCASRISCAKIEDEGHATWPNVFAGGISWGKCLPGYLGQPYRSCLETGNFGSISNPCISANTQCLSENYHNAAWPPTDINTNAQGVCNPGFGGSSSRLCLRSGQWSTSLSGFCKRLYCLAETAGGSLWKATPSNTVATVKCAGGSLAKRTCDLEGKWSSIQGSCAGSGITCKAENYARADWKETEAGQTAEGDCITGWTGTPKRTCGTNGQWHDLVLNHCARA